jgi:trehalose 6-phosphate phosphatase
VVSIWLLQATLKPMDPAELLADRVVRAARRPGASRTLLLDLDGTLAPIVATPDAAEVPAGTLEALRGLIRGGWRIAIVSGRPAAQVSQLVPVRGVRVFGSHGLEGRWPRGTEIRVPRAVRRRLAELARAAATLAAATPGAAVEHKPAGVAIHDRNVAANRLAAWRRRLARWVDGVDLDGLERLRGKRVLELRPVGVNKGTVAETLPRKPGAPRPDLSIVAIGDDRTDEDLFRGLDGRGLSVRVGRPGVRTRAEARLAAPAAVRRFLMRLARTSHRGSS